MRFNLQKTIKRITCIQFNPYSSKLIRFLCKMYIDYKTASIFLGKSFLLKPIKLCPFTFYFNRNQPLLGIRSKRHNKSMQLLMNAKQEEKKNILKQCNKTIGKNKFKCAWKTEIVVYHCQTKTFEMKQKTKSIRINAFGCTQGWYTKYTNMG